MLHQMQEGDMLELVREPENKHDDCTIALHHNMQNDGLVMVNIEKLAKTPDLISKFVDIADKQGNKFIEVLFKYS